MNKAVYKTPHRIELLDVIGEGKHGTFWMLECEKHGWTLCFTDNSGADWCIECVKTMLATAGEVMPYE